MNNINFNPKTLSVLRKVGIITAATFTVSALVMMTALAWFNKQRKVAELHKVKYPNSLYINAAYREDQVYLGLDTVDISEYRVDLDGNIIKYQVDTNGNYVTDQNGEYVKDTSGNGYAMPIEKKEYVFSVSGSNTSYFTLQLAHTNNNLFSYEIWEATQYDTYAEVLADTSLTENQKKSCIKYTTHENAHTENGELIVEGDPIVDAEGEKFYVYGRQLTGEPTVVDGKITYPNGKYYNMQGNGSKLAIKKTGEVYNSYYKKTYGEENTYANVNQYAVPSYWQAKDVPVSLTQNAIDNKLPFCKYFVLVIRWNDTEQSSNEKKESDMVYLSVERTS